MLAGLLNWPQATYAFKVDIDAPTKVAQVTREVDGGLQVVKLPLPAVITTDLRLNEPRYVTLPSIMKARKKAVEVIPAGDLGVDLTPRLEYLEVADPPKRSAGIKVDSVDELVTILKDKGLI